MPDDAADRAKSRDSLFHVLSYPGLLPVYFATLVVTGGQWIQNVVLAAYAYDVSGSAVVVGLVVFAQLGPLLFFGTFSGAIADFVNRRTLLRIAVGSQSVAASLVAVASAFESASLVWLVIPVVACGIAQTLFLSSYTSLMPVLVPHEDLRRVLSLNAAILSGARILGPAAGALLYAMFGQVVPLGLVAVLYAIVVVATLGIPRRSGPEQRPKISLSTLFAGFAVAGADAEIRRILVTIATFSLVCLPFLNQMPVVAEELLAVGTTDFLYSVLFIAIGAGSVIGGLLLGTVLLNVGMAELSRWLLYMFAGLLVALAINRSLLLGIVLMVLLGFAYFGVVTSLITRLQLHLEEAVRGRVMALWFMGFGGLLPVGAALAGPLIDATSASLVLVIGAAAAVPLGWYVGRRPLLLESA